MSTPSDIILYILSDLSQKIDRILAEVSRLHTISSEDFKPEWLSLRQACALKGCSYSAMRHRCWLQPKGGTPDALICGRRAWRRKTILEWVEVPDSEMEEYLRKKAREELNRERSNTDPSYYVRSG